MLTCEGCAGEYKPEDMQVVETDVNLRDGMTRKIRFDGVVCCDIWDDTEPGDWIQLASGEEVQRSLWQCIICDGMYEYTVVKQLVDTNYEDGATAIVCSFCQRRERGRFKVKNV